MMILFDTGPKWLDSDKHSPDNPGYYWGIMVVVRPVKRMYKWDGIQWLGEDGGMPFYFWPQRIPDPEWPPSTAILADIEEQIKRLAQ